MAHDTFHIDNSYELFSDRILLSEALPGLSYAFHGILARPFRSLWIVEDLYCQKRSEILASLFDFPS